MTITIYESAKPNKAIFENKRRKEFFDKFGTTELYVDTKDMVRKMVEMSRWCNNELNEECLFEMG